MSRNVCYTVRSHVLSLHALTLWNTIILSFQYKYQAARCLNIGMSYSVIDGLVFHSGHVFYVLYRFFIPRFLFKKTLSKAKYGYAKIQRATFLEDASAMIFIDFDLLRSPYYKISYLLVAQRWLHTITILVWIFIYKRPFHFIGGH